MWWNSAANLSRRAALLQSCGCSLFTKTHSTDLAVVFFFYFTSSPFKRFVCKYQFINYSRRGGGDLFIMERVVRCGAGRDVSGCSSQRPSACQNLFTTPQQWPLIHNRKQTCQSSTWPIDWLIEWLPTGKYICCYLSILQRPLVWPKTQKWHNFGHQNIYFFKSRTTLYLYPRNDFSVQWGFFSFLFNFLYFYRENFSVFKISFFLSFRSQLLCGMDSQQRQDRRLRHPAARSENVGHFHRQQHGHPGALQACLRTIYG